MTILESYKKEAIEKSDNGKLDAYEHIFIESIRDFSKKELRKLTKKQFLFLRKIAEKNNN